MSLFRAGRAALLAACVAAGPALGCQEQPEPIRLQGNLLTVQNQTGQEWQDVEVWLNDYYRVTRSSLGAGQRLDVPLDAFVAGFGQRFNHRLQAPTGIEVSAKGARGRDVKLVWGKTRRR
jgi:hypothetical protein